MRIRCFAAHLALSVALVAGAAALILGLWYPGSLSRIEGVLPIVGMLVAVDACLGPLLTLVVASPAKPRRELWRDLGVIGLIQACALIYGVHAAYVARPVFVVFDVRQFETVSARELDYAGVVSGSQAAWSGPSPLRGPQWVYAEPPADPAERQRIMAESLSGGPEFKNLPRLFRPWPPDPGAIAAAMRPAEKLRAADRDRVSGRLARFGLDPSAVGVVRLFGRNGEGIVALNRSDLQILFVVPRE